MIIDDAKILEDQKEQERKEKAEMDRNMELLKKIKEARHKSPNSDDVIDSPSKNKKLDKKISEKSTEKKTLDSSKKSDSLPELPKLSKKSEEILIKPSEEVRNILEKARVKIISNNSIFNSSL